MRCIDADKLLDIMKEERDKAEKWLSDCQAFDDYRSQVSAFQTVVIYNKVICLINGMDVINVGKEKPVC